MVIWLAFYNGKGPVQLLNKKQAHHLVRKRHTAKGQLIIGALVNRFIKTIRPSYYKDQTCRGADIFFIEIGGELFGA